MNIITDRSVFCTQAIDEFICPSCQENIAKESWNYFDEWFKGKFDNLICPACGNANEINSYSIEPQCAFSDLGFQFFNWQDFSDNFIAEFQKIMGCEIAVVYMHH